MYRYNKNTFAKHFDFFILDTISIELALFISHFIRFGINPYNILGNKFADLAVTLFFINATVSFFLESYSGILRRDNYTEIKSVFIHCSTVLVILTLYMYFVSISGVISKLSIAYMYIILLPLTYIFRTLEKKTVKNKVKFNNSAKYNVAVLTTIENMEYAINNLDNADLAINSLCVIDAPSQLQYDELPVFKNLDTFLEFLRNNLVDGIFLCLNRDMQLPMDFLNTCLAMGITIHRNIGILENNEHQVIGKMGHFTVLTTSMKIASTRQAFLKRCLDIIGGIVGCIITCVFVVIVGPAIYLKDKGPIFYSQIRVGKNGRKFKIYKFRSMYMDADKRKRELMRENKMSDGMMFKIDNDPRILPGIGHFIRDYSIDEFPQFWNVLKGDMSLVGTRPPTLDEYEKYSYHHKARLAVKPGITGMWQANGRSTITDFEEIVKLDTEYITNWSLMLDIKLLVKTVFAVLKKEGAE